MFTVLFLKIFNKKFEIFFVVIVLKNLNSIIENMQFFSILLWKNYNLNFSKRRLSILGQWHFREKKSTTTFRQCFYTHVYKFIRRGGRGFKKWFPGQTQVLLMMMDQWWINYGKLALNSNKLNYYCLFIFPETCALPRSIIRVRCHRLFKALTQI